MRALLLLVLLAGCNGGEFVVVSVGNFPPGTNKLVARTVLNGRPAQAAEVFTGNFVEPTSFALKYPDGKKGHLSVGVEAWVNDCVAGWQTGEVNLAERADVGLVLEAFQSCRTDFVGAPDMVHVPAGSFFMGCNTRLDDNCNVDEVPSGMVTLDGYQIDRTEVTLAAYRDCIAGGSCGEPQLSFFSDPTFPVDGVTWNDAKKYCEFRGKRLPTEAEWEKAARGTDGRIYPWGNEPPSCELTVNKGCGQGTLGVDPLPVGTHPSGASPYGALDMAGNVSEWVADWHGDYPAGSRTNPTGPASGTEKVMRGGSANDEPEWVRTSVRLSYTPDDALFTGVRCALGQATP